MEKALARPGSSRGEGVGNFLGKTARGEKPECDDENEPLYVVSLNKIASWSGMYWPKDTKMRGYLSLVGSPLWHCLSASGGRQRTRVTLAALC